jgi:hypothetical protein
MLRAVIRDDGLQQILPHTPRYDINTSICEARSSEDGLRIGCHPEPDVASALFARSLALVRMRTTELKERTLLHFSCDLLFIDIWSLQILHAELIQLAYHGLLTSHLSRSASATTC